MFEAGSISFGATGNTTFSLNTISGTPKGIIFFTGGKFGVNETTNARLGHGMADNGNYEWAATELVNSSGDFSRMYSGTDCFVVLDGAAGNPIVRGDFVSFGAGTVTVHLTNANSNYQIGFVVFA